MKKLIFLVTCLLFVVSFAKADFNCVINIKLQNNYGMTQDGFKIGAQTNATDTIDDPLGEFEIPPMMPKDALAVMFNMDSLSASGLYSYRDFRSVPTDKNQFVHRYIMKTGFGGGDTLDVTWGILPKGIDSAKIYDVVLGKINANMVTKQSIRLTNNIIDEYYIMVWYNKDKYLTMPVEPTEFFVYPNPASDKLSVNSDVLYSRYEIYSETGALVATNAGLETNTINISELTNGYYALKLFDQNGSSVYTRFIKLNK